MGSALSVCNKKTGGASHMTSTTPSLADLGKEVGLTFPASARLIGVSRENGMDDLVRFKVELPRGDLPAFLRSTPIPADEFQAGGGGLLGPDDDYWDPSQVKNLRTGQVQLKGARMQRHARANAAGITSRRLEPRPQSACSRAF
jgi:hypothetical protein